MEDDQVQKLLIYVLCGETEDISSDAVDSRLRKLMLELMQRIIMMMAMYPDMVERIQMVLNTLQKEYPQYKKWWDGIGDDPRPGIYWNLSNARTLFCNLFGCINVYDLDALTSELNATPDMRAEWLKYTGLRKTI